jgi:hypothetical protein
VTVQLRNIRPFSQYEPGDTAEVPDGAAFDPLHWEAVTPADPPQPADAPPAGASLPRLPIPAKEM